eukprot:10704092-Lingulodinium_polyedra.AAC.1
MLRAWHLSSQARPPSASEGPTPEPKKARLSWAGESVDDPDEGLRRASHVMEDIMGIAPST